MPKHEAGTPKAISNRIKAKGLQKLRWYCQMCQKQCRDENGFKCHCTSEGHLRQMRIFAENPHSVMDEYSKEFEETFLDVLSRRHGTKRVHSNIVYQEYIGDRHHTHMNSTQWVTLTNFIKYLGKMGKCIADETEKGWYIQWIDRDPLAIARKEASENRKKSDLDDEERQQREINARVEAARVSSEIIPHQEIIEYQERTDGEKVSVNLSNLSLFSSSASRRGLKRTLDDIFSSNDKKEEKVDEMNGNHITEEEKDESENGTSKQLSGKKARIGTKKNSLDLIMEEHQKLKQRELEEEGKKERKDHWLFPGIIVKVMNGKLNEGEFYKKKGLVRKVIDTYIGEIKMLESGKKIRIDQDQLETVIPPIGGTVLIVNGCCRGSKAKLTRLDIDHFCAEIRVESGPRFGTILSNVDYEDICKLAEEYINEGTS